MEREPHVERLPVKYQNCHIRVRMSPMSSEGLPSDGADVPCSRAELLLTLQSYQLLLSPFFPAELGRDAHAGLALVKCQNWHIRDAGIVVKCRSALSRCRFALIAVTTARYPLLHRHSHHRPSCAARGVITPDSDLTYVKPLLYSQRSITGWRLC